MADLARLKIQDIRNTRNGWVAEVEGCGNVPLPWTSLATREQVINDLVSRPDLKLAARITA